MAKISRVLGAVAGAFLVISSIAHSVLGWKQVRANLIAANVPPDLQLGLQAGWQFAGVAMLVFGVIASVVFLRGLQNEPAARLAVTMTGIGYVGFGVWALLISRFDPFFLTFVVPGVLLLAAVGVSGPGRRVSRQ